MALRFVGIGAAKCATTWTYRMLGRHPQVQFPAGKEVNFWSKPAPRDMTWYGAVMGEEDPSVVAGEISVSYVHLSVATMHELYAHAPDVRLFINVRHPVDRAWSRAKMRVRDQGAVLADLTDAQLMEYVFGGNNVAAGDYAAALNRWASVFPAEQMLITRFDDVVARPAWVIERLLGHIGVEPDEQLSTVAQRTRRPSTPDRPLPDGIREMLSRLYAEPMRRLRDEYGIDYTGPGRS